MLSRIYRLYLTGGTGEIELQISSWQMRHQNADGALWFLAVIPNATASVIDSVADRIAGNIKLYTGPRAGNGVESLTKILDIALSSYRYDIGARSASITIESNVVRTNASPGTRVLSGITYKAMSDGRRRVRVSPADHSVAPGDTVDLGGGESWVVSSLTAWAGVSESTMELAEA